MIKLMKYELLRRKNLIIGTVLSMLIIEGATLLSLYKGGGWDVFALILTVLLVVGGLLLPFFDAIIRLYSDFKQKHGYMLFLTPQNGYRVIWSKTLFAALELIASALIIIGCLALSSVAFEHFHSGMVSSFFDTIQAGGGTIIGFGALAYLQLMAQLAIALLAVTVSRTMMQGNSYNWLIALLKYFALAAVVSLVNSVLLLAFGVVQDVLQFTGDTSLVASGLVAKYIAIGAGNLRRMVHRLHSALWPAH